MTENCVCYQNESILQLGARNFQPDEVLVLRKSVLVAKPQGCRIIHDFHDFQHFCANCVSLVLLLV